MRSRGGAISGPSAPRNAGEAPGSGVSAVSWYSEKCRTSCGFPSSRIVKSPALSPAIGLPFASTTRTSTGTTEIRLRNVAAGGC